ncbi:MAG: GNAT family N-acetyltransferase [Saprospiraceae bacterium]|nr:GNAT family N-acetyltransferase [Saprospiraceae bacterium]
MVRFSNFSDDSLRLAQLVHRTDSIIPFLFGQGPKALLRIKALIEKDRNPFSKSNMVVYENDQHLVQGILLAYVPGQMNKQQENEVYQAVFNTLELIWLWLKSLFLKSIEDKTLIDGLYIQNISVDPSARGGGIGTQLIQHIEQWAIAQKITSLWLDVAFDNPKAKKLYERQGFSVESEHPILLLRNGFFRMKKNISTQATSAEKQGIGNAAEKISLYPKTLILTVLLLLLALNSKAQMQYPSVDFRHIIKVSVGYDYNLVALDLGYAYYQQRLKTAVFVDITQGTALLGSGNLRTQVGVQTWQGSFQKFNFSNALAFVYTHSMNKAGNYDGLGLNFHMNVGLRLKRLGFGADFQYNPFLMTYIKHSDFWRQYYYSEAKDGWYKLTANTWRIGGYISAYLDKQHSLELNLRAGYQTSGQLDKLIPGFYAIFGFNKKFKQQ